MTEREKIIEIIDHSCAFYCGSNVYMDDEQEGIIADALIAAGLKFDRNISYTATFNLAQLERINDLERRLAATDHRAEVAEKALSLLCDATMRSEYVIASYPSTNTKVWNKQELYDYCIEQAEKELAEERKDG